MLEILFLIRFCKRLTSIAREKNRSSSWGALGAVLWIAGEITGTVLGYTGKVEGYGVYGVALAGAALGAVLAYVIVKTLTPIPSDNGLPTARLL